jgi:hypothetical protein
MTTGNGVHSTKRRLARRTDLTPGDHEHRDGRMSRTRRCHGAHPPNGWTVNLRVLTTVNGPWTNGTSQRGSRTVTSRPTMRSRGDYRPTFKADGPNVANTSADGGRSRVQTSADTGGIVGIGTIADRPHTAPLCLLASSAGVSSGRGTAPHGATERGPREIEPRPSGRGADQASTGDLTADEPSLESWPPIPG